jgi:Domain of unknown function (DUF4178)
MALGQSGKSITCPSCGGTTEVRAAGYTVTLVCQYCSSVLDVANPDVQIITEYHEAAGALAIPLGTRGDLKGVTWEVIGFLQRGDGYAVWDEYLLFNPYSGYRWLIDTGRGWSFGTMLTTAPTLEGGGGFVCQGQTFTAFFSGNTAKVLYVLGEFYWRVAVDEEVAASDYVSVPRMLSLEQSGSEINWTLSEWLDPKIVTAAFGVVASNGWPPLPHQPSPWGKGLFAMIVMGVVSFFAIIVMIMMFGGSGARVEQQFTLGMDKADQSIPIGTLTVERAYQAVTIKASAEPLDNAWVDLEYSLVNRATQQSLDASGVLEQYSGSDSDGAWSEGDRSSTTKFASVPRGTYDLIVDASAHKWGGGSMNPWDSSAPSETPVQVIVRASPGGMFGSNLFLLSLLLFAPLIFIGVKHASFEKARLGERDGAESSGDWEDDDD